MNRYTEQMINAGLSEADRLRLWNEATWHLIFNRHAGPLDEIINYQIGIYILRRLLKASK